MEKGFNADTEPNVNSYNFPGRNEHPLGDLSEKKSQDSVVAKGFLCSTS